MNEQLDIQFKSIQQKLLLLVKEYQLLKKETTRLKFSVDELQQKLTVQSAELEKFRQQTELSTTKSTVFNEADKAELEKRINTYLKEIDNCISLLNVD
jgi:thiamine biosynthesis lipoprotein ApbE